MKPEDFSLLIVRSLDQSKKVRTAFFMRLFKEKIDL